ncbi:Grm5, partial [Symbiodinium necroappetens]
SPVERVLVEWTSAWLPVLRLVFPAHYLGPNVVNAVVRDALHAKTRPLKVVTLCKMLVDAFTTHSTKSQGFPLGVLGPWSPHAGGGPALLVAIIAAHLDYQKHWDVSLAARLGPPIISMPVTPQPNASISLRVASTESKPQTAIASALDLIWGLDGGEPVIGLIGTTYSSVTMPVATVAAAQQIPQVSYSATSTQLSNKDLYPFFLRTAPPDKMTSVAFWRWLLQFDVRLATCLYTTGAYGQGLYDAVREIARINGQVDRVQGQALRYMPQVYVKEEARAAVKAARQIGSRFIILSLDFSMALPTLEILEEEGMLGPGWQILGADTIYDDVVTLRRPVGIMVFRAQGEGQKFPDFVRLWSRLQPQDIIGTEARDLYGLDKMSVPMRDVDVYALLNATSDEASAGNRLHAYFAFSFDACYAFIVAINMLLAAGTPASAIRGPVLLEELRRTQFTGVSGEVSFDENGDRLGPYELLNLQVDGQGQPQFVVAGFFSAATLNFTIHRDLTWMDGSSQSMPPTILYSCDAGFYQDELSNQCKLCPKGKMCSGGVSALSIQCPRGTFTDEVGMTNCTPCAQGTFAPDSGSVGCFPCQPGFVASAEGMETCSICPRGSYMPFQQGIECLLCGKQQTTGASGASDESACHCPEGFFMCGEDGEDGCVPCPEGLYCLAGLDAPQQQRGFWTPQPSSSRQCHFSVLRCRDQYECPGGPLGTCADGREGQACNNCKVSHYADFSEGTQGGQCQPCARADLLPAIFTMVVTLILLYQLTKSGIYSLKVSLNTLTAAAVASQLVMAVQTLAAIRELSIDWQEPARTLMNLTRLLTFDLHLVRATCLFVVDSPSLHFASQLLACPALCGLLLLRWLMWKILGYHQPFNIVLNQCGLLVFAFFLSITRSTLTPFQCVSNPDGSSSMLTHPGILCFQSEEHAALSGLAVAGILTQPVAVLVWATYVIITYPSRVASGRMLRFVNRYHFLFHRFKPESYYYGLLLLYRNGLVALLPIFLVGAREFQLPLMGALLLVIGFLQAHTFPWRTVPANLIEIFLNGFLIVLLLAAAPLLLINVEGSTALLGWLVCVPLLGIFVVVLVGLARAALKHIRRTKLYGIFLCHHKGGGGSLCRLMKILIAGEITAAWKNGITTVPLFCDGFQPLSDEELKLIPDYWTAQQKQALANYGVELGDVLSAYVWVQHELSSVEMPRFGLLADRDEAVVDMLRLCGFNSWKGDCLPSSKEPRAPEKARILITSCVADAEVLSACEVMQLLLQAHLHVECAVVQGVDHLIRWRPWAYYLVVLLFKGIFRDPEFARILLSACARGASSLDRSLELVPVVADTNFEFLSHPGSKRENADDQGTEGTDLLRAAIKNMFNVLALPFSPLASEGMQRRQVIEIAGRMHRYKEWCLQRNLKTFKSRGSFFGSLGFQQ